MPLPAGFIEPAGACCSRSPRPVVARLTTRTRFHTEGSMVFESPVNAILATVTDDDQHVGFRAMIMKQAIKYNLAGSAKNEANEIVHFTLQGDRIGWIRRSGLFAQQQRRNRRI